MLQVSMLADSRPDPKIEACEGNGHVSPDLSEALLNKNNSEKRESIYLNEVQ